MSFRRSVLLPAVAVALTPLISGCFNAGFPGGGVSISPYGGNVSVGFPGGGVNVNAGPFGAGVNVGFPGGGVNVNAGAFGGGVSVAARGFNMNLGWPGRGYSFPRQQPPQWAPPPPVQWAPPAQQLPPLTQAPPIAQLPPAQLPVPPVDFGPPGPPKKALSFQGAPEPIPVGDARETAIGFDDLRSR